jgi:hypothetical protein
VIHDNPLLRVTKGDASSEDIAALITLFSVMGSSAGTESNPDEAATWNSSRALFKSFPVPGPGAWWSSGLPQ